MRRFSTAARPVRGILLGAPGSGKGTQAAWLKRDFGIVPLSSGDLLRRLFAEQKNSAQSEQVSRGGFVDDAVICQAMTRMLDEHKSHVRVTFVTKIFISKSWLLDGFPRTVSQARYLEKWLKDSHQSLDFVINIDVPAETILGRIQDRWIHVPSGRVYNTLFNPPKIEGMDDFTGEVLVRRPDDEPEVVKARLEKYQEETLPLLEFYKNVESRAETIVLTFSGTESQEIYPRLCQSLEKQFPNQIQRCNYNALI